MGTICIIIIQDYNDHDYYRSLTISCSTSVQKIEKSNLILEPLGQQVTLDFDITPVKA